MTWDELLVAARGFGVCWTCRHGLASGCARVPMGDEVWDWARHCYRLADVSGTFDRTVRYERWCYPPDPCPGWAARSL